MTRGISPCPTRSSVLRWLPSIEHGFALRRKSTVSDHVQRQVIQRRHPVTGHGFDSAGQCACRIVAFSPTPRIQTP